MHKDGKHFEGSVFFQERVKDDNAYQINAMYSCFKLFSYA